MGRYTLSRLARVISLGWAISLGGALIVALLHDAARAAAVDAGAAWILYVDDDALDSGDGQTWRTAFRYLQDALAAAHASNGAVTEIRIAHGTYKPDQGAPGTQTPGDRTATFLIPSGLALRGGYAGLTGDDPDARDWNKFPTILSGDLIGNDGPPGTFQNFQDNTYRVMQVVGTEVVTILEGLVVSGADGIPNANSPHLSGGGLQCITGRVEVLHCVFEANRAPYGGGAYLAGSDSLVNACRFVRNQVRGPANFGGGLYGGTQVVDCEFFGNRAIIGAGAGGATAGNFTRCYFENNTAAAHGGAIITFAGQITDCEFVRNQAAEEGGAIYGFAKVVGSTFRENNADSGGAIRGIVTVINSTFIDNRTLGFAGMAFRGGGTIINCEFIANQALNTSAGGAVSACRPMGGLQICSPAHFINCIFNSNFSYTLGGGAWIESGQTATFTNCTFTNNTSQGDGGGAISTNNLTQPPGIAIVRNSILWNDSPSELAGGSFDVQFTCIANGWPGKGNIDADPLFNDPLGPDGIAGTSDDDLRLQPGSPCIDAADNSAVPPDAFDLDGDGDVNEPIPIDLVGQRRFRNDRHTPNTGNPGFGLPLVDMGAYEFQLLADIDQDGRVGVADLLRVLSSWGPCANPANCPADIMPYPHGNGRVDVWDLLDVILSWGQ